MSSPGAPLPREITPRTVPDLLEQRTRERPTGLGFVARFHDGQYRPVTYAEWSQRSDQLATQLATTHGITQGSRVAWALSNRNGGEALILYHAILKLGAVNVPVNTRLTLPEISYILEHSEATLVVLGDDLADRFSEVPAGWPPVLHVDGLKSTDPAAAGGCPTLTDADVESIVYTSGTTGRPKGVVHTHGSAIAAGLQWADAFRLGQQDVLQSPFPIFSGGALHFNSLSILWAGGCFVLDEQDTEQSLKLMERWRTTVCVAVPTIYQFMLEYPGLDDLNLESVRILDYGGAAMPPSVIEQMRKRFPGAGLMQTYGLTEAGPGGTYLPEEYALSKLGSVGNRPMGRYTQFRVADEHGQDVGPGEVGEFLLRGPSIMQAYYKDEEATAEAFRGGWLHTGDVVRIDNDGFLYHVDRLKDIIVRGGYNISSVEVEAALAAHPDVFEAAVIAKPHEKLGEDVKAFVVLRPGAATAAADLTAWCRERLADFKVPRDITFVDTLPRNAAGKVLKRQLRDASASAPAEAASTEGATRV